MGGRRDAVLEDRDESQPASLAPSDVTPSDVEPTDAELLVRHRDGDGEAFATLVTRYRAPVYSYLVRMGIDAATRDDLFQEIFLRLHRGAGRFAPERPFQPWLFTIVANAARNHARGRRLRTLRFVPAAHDPPEPEDPAPDGARAAEGREALSRVERAIRTLPRGQREVLLLAAIERQPLSAVAQALGVAVGTVKSRLARARLALAQVLAATPNSESNHEVSR